MNELQKELFDLFFYCFISLVFFAFIGLKREDRKARERKRKRRKLERNQGKINRIYNQLGL